MTSDARRFALLLPLVVLSGAAALAVEVVVSRMLARTIGSTSWGVALTLSGFLGGMGLGAWMGEWWLEWSVLRGKGPLAKPLLAYAACEIVALVLSGVFVTGSKVIGLMLTLPGGEGLLLGAVVILSIPWGASFPCIVRAAGDVRDAAVRLRLVYGFNAVGGALGALGAGLVVIPTRGEWGVLLQAAVLEITAACGAIALDRAARGRAVPPEVPGGEEGSSWAKAKSRPSSSLVAFVFASGLVVLYWEALWTRILTLTVGSTVYAFSLISASVLAGIGLGSLAWSGEWFRRHAGWVLSLLSAAVAGGLFFAVPYLPDAYLAAVRVGGLSPILAGSLGAGCVVFGPNFLLGSLFPWGTSRVVGRSGRLYAVNALGCVAGALMGGPIGAQCLGLETAHAVGVLALVLLSFLGLCASGARSRGLFVAWSLLVVVLVTGLSAAGGILGFSWDWRRVLSGVYQWSPADLASLPLEESIASREILHLVKGRETIVSAERECDANTLYIRGNGKVEGGIPLDSSRRSLADLPTQILLGDLPCACLQPRSNQRVLQIGLGSGVTLGALWNHGRCFSADRIDLIEIEPGFLEALFAVRGVGGALEFVPYEILGGGEGPRPGLHFGDARRLISLELRASRWDAIVSQPSEPWTPGSAPLFTVEFFEMASKHLTDGGIFFQWLQLYKLEWDTFRMAVRTFRRAFPVVFVLRPPGTGEVILLGSSKSIPLEGMLEAVSGPGLAYALIEEPIDRLAAFLVGPNGVDDLMGLERTLPVNTDSRSELEHLSVRGLYASGDLALTTLRQLQEAGGRDPISHYLAPHLRSDHQFLRRLATRNMRLGDFAEAMAIIEGDESADARSLRTQMEAEKRK